MKQNLLVMAMIAAMEAVAAAEESALLRRYRALERAYQAAQTSYFAALRAATTGAEQRQADARRPDVEDYSRRFLALAKTEPADPAAFEALAWVTAHNPRGREAEEALELLAKHHVKDKRLGSVLQNVKTSRSPAVEALLRAALKDCPHRAVCAQACYGLASLVMAKIPASTGARGSRDSRAEDAKSEKGESTSTDKPAEPEREEAIALFERLAQEYGGVKAAGRKTYGDLARAGLARLRPKSGRSGGTMDSGSAPVGLEIGMVAPEIAGRDTNGRPMRLGEYRGRVVVLDFWGHW
jgi:hypothetical protein